MSILAYIYNTFAQSDASNVNFTLYMGAGHRQSPPPPLPKDTLPPPLWFGLVGWLHNARIQLRAMHPRPSPMVWVAGRKQAYADACK